MKFLNFFLDLLFPVFCLGCEKEGQWLCHDCKQKVKFWDYNKCPYCQKTKQCDCQQQFVINNIFVGCNYDENIVIQNALRSFKYKYATKLAQDLMSIFLNQQVEFFSDIDIIIPVPLHKKRLKQRGFNQSDILAQILAKQYNLELQTELVHRKISTKQQAKLNKKQRIYNVKNAFQCNNLSKIKQKTVLLVDDVLTTGSTINECAKALPGTKQIKGFVIAKG